MPGKYMLVDKEPVAVDDLFEWAEWFESADRMLAKTWIDPYTISTVFMGLNYNFGEGPPILFETMVFGEGSVDLETRRYSTYAEALKGHEEMVGLVKKEVEK